MKFRYSWLILFCIITIFSQLRADWIITCKDGSQIKLAFSQGNLKEEKEVFLKAFTNAYIENQTIINDLKNLKKMDLPTFLNTAFEEEENDFNNKKDDVIFITAKSEDGKTVGFVSFDKGEDKNENNIYIRELAVDPSFGGKGIGKGLVFSILNIWDKPSKIQLVTRRANSIALDFYQKIGFTLSDFVHPGLDPRIYCGLNFFLSDDERKEILANYQEIQKSGGSSAFKILYSSIASSEVKNIPIADCGEDLIDLKNANNERIVPLTLFNKAYDAGHNDNGKVRLGLYYKLIALLEYLPPNVGIAFFEAYRPLWKQQEYFDKVFKEFVQQFNGDLEKAYRETSILVSPFIDNIPVHCTGAAIDFTLFTFNAQGAKNLLDLGKFGVILGKNDQAQTLTDCITEEQRRNRLLLLNAASKAGLVNYGSEWWHYSYGDRAWAFVEKKEQAIYGLANKEDANLVSKDEYFKSFSNLENFPKRTR